MHTGDSSISIARPAHVSQIRVQGVKPSPFSNPSYPSLAPAISIPAMRRSPARRVGNIVADNRRIRARDSGVGEKEKMERDPRRNEKGKGKMRGEEGERVSGEKSAIDTHIHTHIRGILLTFLPSRNLTFPSMMQLLSTIVEDSLGSLRCRRAVARP